MTVKYGFRVGETIHRVILMVVHCSLFFVFVGGGLGFSLGVRDCRG